MQLQNCVFPNFNLQIQSSKSNLRSSFANLFNFKFSKTCWKSPKLYKRILAHFEKMSLARWFWAFLSFFEKKSKLSNFESENSIGWERFSIFISFILPITKSVCFSSFYEAKHPFFFKKRKTLKINAPNSFFQNEPKFLYLILDFFNRFLKTWSWTSWQKKSGDWT